jgi:hypothetical protein
MFFVLSIKRKGCSHLLIIIHGVSGFVAERFQGRVVFDFLREHLRIRRGVIHGAAFR